MTERATLEALLARVLVGTGPNRELDADIARALGWKPLYRDDYSKWWPPLAVADARERKRSILHHPTQPLPMFTASLDAVLRDLLSDGWHAEIGTRPDYPWARLFKDVPLRVTNVIWGPTPPRALIAACIKARM